MSSKDFDYYDQPGKTEEIDLARLDDDFEQAVVEEREREDIPDGKYQVNVERVELVRAQTSGNPMLKWTLRIIAPKYHGRLMWRNNVMASRENLKWLKTDLLTCGVSLEKLSELPRALGKLLNVKIEVTRRTRGENVNIYFNRRILLEEPGDGFGPTARGGLPMF